MRAVGKGTLATVCWVGPKPMTLMTWPSTLLVDATLKKNNSIQTVQRKSLQVGQGKAVLFFSKNILGGFPGSSVVKNPPANTGDTGSIPGLGRSHMLWSNKTHVPQLLNLCSRAGERKLLNPGTVNY